MIISVKIKKNPDAKLPVKQTPGSVGYDLHAFTPEKAIIIYRMQVALIPTGIFLEIPQGYDAEIRPRSGLSTKYRIIMPNSPGTIDSDYRGEILVPLMNLGDTDFVVSNQMRIAQLVLRASVSINWIISGEIDQNSTRGLSGFGSTGTK